MNSVTNYGSEAAFDVSILFILFNRPQHARQVLNRIRQVRPTNLFIAIDGPRANRSDDQNKVRQCIALIDEIDWPCTITKLIRERNLGCKQAVSSAIDWFFDQVEEGIIMEDDCLPDVSFFEFCRVMLQKYANESRVMHIGGANLYAKHDWSTDSYFFSLIPHIWGWATWRRAWRLYDATMSDYPQFKSSNGIEQIVTNISSLRYWRTAFDGTYTGRIDTWDYQWVYTIWKSHGLCIIPNQNLVTNIGFDGTGTHTIFDSNVANLSVTSIDNKYIKHPKTLSINNEAVEYALATLYQQPSWLQTKVDRVRKWFN